MIFSFCCAAYSLTAHLLGSWQRPIPPRWLSCFICCCFYMPLFCITIASRSRRLCFIILLCKALLHGLRSRLHRLGVETASPFYYYHCWACGQVCNTVLFIELLFVAMDLDFSFVVAWFNHGSRKTGLCRTTCLVLIALLSFLGRIIGTRFNLGTSLCACVCEWLSCLDPVVLHNGFVGLVLFLCWNALQGI